MIHNNYLASVPITKQYPIHSVIIVVCKWNLKFEVSMKFVPKKLRPKSAAGWILEIKKVNRWIEKPSYLIDDFLQQLCQVQYIHWN